MYQQTAFGLPVLYNILEDIGLVGIRNFLLWIIYSPGSYSVTKHRGYPLSQC